MITVVTGTDFEKLKGDFESVINGMNMVGKIPYDVYSELFDTGTDCIQKAYELGKAELEKENTELKNRNAELKGMYAHSAREAGTYKQFLELKEKENAELKNRNQELLESCEGATMMYKDLQKAKEIIKKYLTIGIGGKITQNYLDVTKEAEQFLNSEVGK